MWWIEITLIMNVKNDDYLQAFTCLIFKPAQLLTSLKFYNLIAKISKFDCRMFTALKSIGSFFAEARSGNSQKKNRILFSPRLEKKTLMWLYHEEVCQCRARMDGELFCTSESPPTFSSSAVKTKWLCGLVAERPALIHTQAHTHYIHLISHHKGSTRRGSIIALGKAPVCVFSFQELFYLQISRSGCFCQTSLAWGKYIQCNDHVWFWQYIE